MSGVPIVDGVLWHDIECGDYKADLPLWEELGDVLEKGEMILELGCGTGRVTMHLTRRSGQVVVGIDRDLELIKSLWLRSRGTQAYGEPRDVRDFEYDDDERFGLVLAPMQLIQLLDYSEERIACLACVRDCMTPGARAAFAIVEDLPHLPEEDVEPLLPDVRQFGDWVYSSLPLPPEVGDEEIVLRRLRQIVAPDGTLREELNEVTLRPLSALALEGEAYEAGLTPAGRRKIPASDAHVGSTVVLFERRP